jgi:uncharacterized coiled-coil protein SlyX
MTDETASPILPILRDIQARLGRLEVRMTNLELRMTAQEQHLVALSIGDPVGQGRIDALARHLERRQDLAGPA